jgi:hypothetical protein
MATIDKNKLIDISEELDESLVVDNINQYQGLVTDTETDFNGLVFEVTGDDLVISGNSILGNDKTITIKGYGKANGKSKFDYLVKAVGDNLTVVGNLIADSLVDNNNHYEASTLIDDKGKFSSTVNTSVFNDTVDLSGFQAEDPDEAAYIKKGFTVKTAQGDDKITGSVLSDTVDAGAGDDIVTASAGNDKYTLGAGSNTANYNVKSGVNYVSFDTDTYNLTRGENLTLTVKDGVSAISANQLDTKVQGNDVVSDVYLQSTIGFSEVKESYSKETRNYFDSAKITTNDGATVDLKVTLTESEPAEVDKVFVYDATAEGEDKYVDATDTYKTLVNVTAGYQRLYVVAGQEEGTIDAEKSHIVDSSGTDFEDHTALTYLVTTQDYEAGLSEDGKKVDWTKSGAAMYVASATGKVGTVHNYTYYVADDMGVVKSVSVADLKKEYVVKETIETAYDYDSEGTPKWTKSETPGTPSYAVVKKEGEATTAYYEVFTAQNGAKVYVETTEADIAEVTTADDALVVEKLDGLKAGSIVIKNATKGTADAISINTTDILTEAFNRNVAVSKNKITGTALGDVVDLSEAPINEKITGYVVNTGAGNDEITGSAGDDTITAGLAAGDGHNTINIINKVDEDDVAFGDDVINLTKGEVTTVDFEENMTASNVSIVGKDVVITDGENGTVTFKGLAAKDLVGEDGAVLVDNLGDVRDLARHDVTLDDKTTKFSSAYLGADVDVAANTSKALTVDLSKTQYDNTVVLTNAKGKVTVKGGSAGDTVTAGAGADTVTLGKGTNTLTKAGLGDDVVNLTKDEDLTVGFTTDTDSIDWKVVKNDVVVTTLDDEGEELGSVTFKNFAAKDPDADVTLDVDGLEQFTEDKALDALQFKTTWNDDEDAVAVAGETIVTSKTKSFTGSRLIDVVDASKFTLYNGEDAITVVEKPEDFVEVKPKRSDYNTKEEYNAALAVYKAALAEYKEALAEYNTYAKAKGVTVNGKDGANEFTGSIYADTYKGGVDNDTITASLGNDTYTLGAGANVADYTAAEHYHNDTYNLAKEGSLELQYAEGTELTYTKVGNDILVSEGEGDYVTLKNLTSGKVNDDVKVKIGDDAAAGWWTKTINVEAESATVTGTRANDAYHSERAAGTTFVESYTANLGFGNDTITVDLDDVDKKAADTIKITTSDKAADKLSAYEFGYNFNEGTLTVETEKGNISYTSEDYSKGLNLIDATNTKWAFELAATDLSKSKTNNIAWAAGNVVDSKKNDIIIGADADQTFTYTAGKDLYKGGTGNDTYKVDLNKNTTLVVSDNQGANQLNLGLENTDKYVQFFNVKASGDADYTSDLVILNQASFYNKKGAIVKAAQSLVNEFAAGTVVLEGAIKYDADAETNKTTCDNFTISEGTASTDKTLEQIRSTVASWLATEGYEDSMAVLAGNDKGDIATLMQIYSAGAVPNA